MSYTRGPGVLHWHSIDTLNSGFLTPADAVESQTWGGADRTVYVPVAVRHRVVVKQLWYANGTTATGNYDIGLYDAAGTALLRKGSAAKTTTGAEIVWNCTDTTIGPGIYYVALAMSVSTDTTIIAFVNTAHLGVLSESVFPLPATATWTTTETSRYPVAGMFLDTRVT